MSHIVSAASEMIKVLDDIAEKHDIDVIGTKIALKDGALSVTYRSGQFQNDPTSGVAMSRETRENQ